MGARELRGVDAEELIKQLRKEHGCDESCPYCRDEIEEYTVHPFGRWNEFTASDTALRIAHAVVDKGATFPVFSDDPLEQFLIEEAVLGGYYDMKKEFEKEAQAEAEAKAKAQGNLADFKAGGGI